MLRATGLRLLLLGALTCLCLAPAARAADDEPLPGEVRRADISGALIDSLKLLGIEHAIRIGFQEKTRRELPGPFWTDYRQSVRWPRQWEDTDSWLVNYIGHPLHGAAAGYIWIEHDPRSTRDEFGLSRGYWMTRWRSVAWSAGYSLQFEIGPLSEASIGNVGRDPKTTGWVDYVVTPGGGLAILLAEDALDHFFIKWVEERSTNRVARASIRMLFNPARTFANLAMNRAPWSRDGRSLSW